MKLGVVKKILKEDVKGAPSWIDGLLAILNQFIDVVVTALNGRLTFKDNILGYETTLDFTHGVELEVNPQSSGRKVKGITVIDAQNKIVSGYGFTRKSNGNIGITINFTAGGTTQTKCTVQIQFG